MPTQPQIAIVGRPNVGKSALFNRLAARRIAIVHDRPGVTRDRISAPCAITEKPCELVDTGGIGAGTYDEFADQVTIEARIAIDTADIILFVVDIREGINPIDEVVANLLRKAAQRVILIANKADHDDLNMNTADFAGLGFGNGIPISAEHGRGMTELADRLNERLENIEEKAAEEEAEALAEGLKIAVVGKPNAGKSSLINTLLNSDRTIVSDVAGTTRDAIDIPYTYDNERHLLIDTAGMRPRSRMDDAVEVFSAMRSERSIRRADICLLVMDLAAGISSQDRKIARLIQSEKKPCIIIANKFDLYHPDANKKDRIEEATEHIKRELFFLSYAPFVCVSALKGQAIQHIFRTIQSVRESAKNQISTGKLNRLLQDAFIKNPPHEHRRHHKRLKLLYATTAVNDRYLAIPVPEYILFVNDKHLVNDSYKNYLTNTLQDHHPTPGIPVPFSFRSRR